MAVFRIEKDGIEKWCWPCYLEQYIADGWTAYREVEVASLFGEDVETTEEEIAAEDAASVAAAAAAGEVHTLAIGGA